MTEVARGRLSKQIAGDLGISETTVKVHRSNLMRKMKIRSLTELARSCRQAQSGARAAEILVSHTVTRRGNGWVIHRAYLAEL